MLLSGSRRPYQPMQNVGWVHTLENFSPVAPGGAGEGEEGIELGLRVMMVELMRWNAKIMVWEVFSDDGRGEGGQGGGFRA